MTLRRFGLAVFALALAAAAVQVPACEYDPTSPSPSHHAAAPAVGEPASPSARLFPASADRRA